MTLRRLLGASAVWTAAGLAVLAHTANANDASTPSSISIDWVEPSPAIPGMPAKFLITQYNSDGKPHPFKLKGQCIDTYHGDDVPYVSKLTTRSSMVSLWIKADFKAGECTVEAWDLDSFATDRFTFAVEVTSDPVDSGDPASASTTIPATTGQGTVASGGSSTTVSPNSITTTTGAPKVAGTTVSVADPDGTLPRTGSSSISQIWLGTALTALGAVLVVLTRRRAKRPDTV